MEDRGGLHLANGWIVSLSVKILFPFFSLQATRNETILVAARATIIAYGRRSRISNSATMALLYKKIYFSAVRRNCRHYTSPCVTTFYDPFQSCGSIGFWPVSGPRSNRTMASGKGGEAHHIIGGMGQGQLTFRGNANGDFPTSSFTQLFRKPSRAEAQLRPLDYESIHSRTHGGRMARHGDATLSLLFVGTFRQASARRYTGN